MVAENGDFSVVEKEKGVTAGCLSHVALRERRLLIMRRLTKKKTTPATARMLTTTMPATAPPDKDVVDVAPLWAGAEVLVGD